MRVVISDTSPLHYLAHLGHLQLLHALFGQVILPETVRRELLSAAPQFTPAQQTLLPALHTARQEGWLEIFSAPTAPPPAAVAGLDPGERDAICLATHLHADLILIDERLGRLAAPSLGFQVTGTLALLLQAKAAGLLTRINPELQRLRTGTSFTSARKSNSTSAGLPGNKNPHLPPLRQPAGDRHRIAPGFATGLNTRKVRSRHRRGGQFHSAFLLL